MKTGVGGGPIDEPRKLDSLEKSLIVMRMTRRSSKQWQLLMKKTLLLFQGRSKSRGSTTGRVSSKAGGVWNEKKLESTKEIFPFLY